MSNPLFKLALFVPTLIAASPAPVAKVAGTTLRPAAAALTGACSGVLPLSTDAGSGVRPGERFEYELTLEGAYMGKLELSVGDMRDIDGAMALPLFGRLRTNAFVSAVRPVEGRYQAFVHPETLEPVGVRVEAKVGEDARWEKVRFDKGGRRVETHYQLLGRQSRRAFVADHPLLEGLSLLHFARRVTLQTGLSACQDILSTRRVWRVHAKVLGRETVDTPVGPKPAFRVRTVFTRRENPKSKKPIEIDILLGDMPGRPPLAFEMTQSRYHGRASLIRWKPGRRS